MPNITLSVDEETLKLARHRATQEGTSVDTVLRDFLVGYAGTDQRYARATEELLALSEAVTSASGESGWRREDLSTGGSL